MTNQSEIKLITERLRFETWLHTDAKLLFELHADPKVQVAYPSDPLKWTLEGINRRLSEYMREQAAFGFTKWKLSLADGTFVGRAGWSPWQEATLEIGYAVKPQFWGNGYASEAARALVDWAQEHRRHESLVGFALPNNYASIRVLEKIGMEFLDYREIAGAKFAYHALKV